MTLLEQDNYKVVSEKSSQYLLIKSNRDKGDDPTWSRYLIDKDDRVLRILSQISENNLKLVPDLHIYNQDYSQSCGKLPHWIVADAYGFSLDEVRKNRIYFKDLQNKSDLRLENLLCPVVPMRETQGAKILRNQNELLLLFKRYGNIVKFDYSKNLESLMCQTLTGFNFRDAEYASAIIAKTQHQERLHHVVMALHYYGDLPVDGPSFLDAMNRFRQDYLSHGNEIDHLNSDTLDDRLQNLMLMPGAINLAKSSVSKTIKPPYFMWLKRYDDDLITLQAGRCTPLQAPEYLIEGVYSPAECLKVMQDFKAEISFDTKSQNLIEKALLRKQAADKKKAGV